MLGDIELVGCGGGLWWWVVVVGCGGELWWVVVVSCGGDGMELCKNWRCKGRGVIKVVAESLGVLLNLVILE